MYTHNVTVDNVNKALSMGLRLLSAHLAHTESSRNGPVRVMPGPVVTTYLKPTERVLFGAVRDANPFFHLFEALWMLAGRNDLPFLVQFNSKFGAYSDDGGATQPAAYGFRWTKYFGYDQIEEVIRELSERPDSRRAVLAMWDSGYSMEHRGGDVLEFCRGDLTRAIAGSADIPCNTQCFFQIKRGCLDMTVTCRSNDIVWGAYGANAVHFSILMEYVAARLGVAVGVMTQFSNNYHYYEGVIGDRDAAIRMADDSEKSDHYNNLSMLSPMAMFQDPAVFMADLPRFIDYAAADGLAVPPLNDPFLAEVAVPMRAAWAAHKSKAYQRAEALASEIRADDWRRASKEWLERRAIKHREKSRA